MLSNSVIPNVHSATSASRLARFASAQLLGFLPWPRTTSASVRPPTRHGRHLALLPLGASGGKCLLSSVLAWSFTSSDPDPLAFLA